jgi:hypothetical protein
MNPEAFSHLVDVVGSAVAGFTGIVATFSFAALCFPSIRGSVAEWISNRGMRNADAVAVTEEMAALRGEVYALRAELGTIARTLGAPTTPPRLGPGAS